MNARAVAAFLAAALALALFASPQAVLAHANIAESAPAGGSVLAEPPASVTIKFTEPLVPSLSQIRVLDSLGAQVDAKDSAVSATDPTAMAVSLPTLANGTYIVAWNNLSSVDGHAVRGSFFFSIGEPITGTPDVPEPPLLQSPAEPVVRWLELLGLMTAAGGLAFQAFILKTSPYQRRGRRVHAPGEVPSPPSSPRLADLYSRLHQRSQRLILAGIALALLASFTRLLLQAQGAAGGSLLDAFGDPLRSVLATSFGRLWLLRSILLGILLGAVLTASLPSLRGSAKQPWIRTRYLATWVAVLLIMAAALLTLSLTSHAAATAPVKAEAVASDYLHLIAASLWVGGLIHLGVALHLVLTTLRDASRRYVLMSVIPRFSVLASLCVGTLIVTGLYSAWAQVTQIVALKSPYGFTLIVKIIIVAGLAAIGGINLTLISPRLRKGGRSAVWLRRLVTGEAVLALLVLFAAGVLTSLEPARQWASRDLAAKGKTLEFQESTPGAAIGLSVSPAKVGPNKVVVTLKDALGRPIANATSVDMKLAYLGADLGEAPRPAVNQGDGSYMLDGAVVGIAGLWQVEVAVQRPDAFDARTAFRFAIAPTGAASSATIAPDAVTGRVLFAIEIALLGAVLVGTSLPLGSIWTPKGRFLAAPGAVTLLAGVAVLFAFPREAAVTPSGNPFPPTASSLAIGEQLYIDKCIVCHGVYGRGDGPGAANLNPPPLDLTIHVPLHPEAAIHAFIRDGVPGTAMPAWAGTLTDDQIWHLVNYLQTLPDQAHSTPPP